MTNDKPMRADERSESDTNAVSGWRDELAKLKEACRVDNHLWIEANAIEQFIEQQMRRCFVEGYSTGLLHARNNSGPWLLGSKTVTTSDEIFDQLLAEGKI